MPLTQMGCMFHERIATHEFQGIALDLAERESIVNDLGSDKHTMLLYNHGILIGGPSIAHAFTRLYHFEDCAGVQLKAMAAVAGGATLKHPDPGVVLKTREQFEGGAAQGGADVLLPEWPALGQAIGENMNAALNGLATPEEALENAEQEMRDILGQ